MSFRQSEITKKTNGGKKYIHMYVYILEQRTGVIHLIGITKAVVDRSDKNIIPLEGGNIVSKE